jgi:hypothetical protein
MKVLKGKGKERGYFSQMMAARQKHRMNFTQCLREGTSFVACAQNKT